MEQTVCYILTLAFALALVVVLTGNLLKLSELKRPGKTTIILKLINVFEVRMEHEDEQQTKAV